jgi:hypothetical protein
MDDTNANPVVWSSPGSSEKDSGRGGEGGDDPGDRRVDDDDDDDDDDDNDDDDDALPMGYAGPTPPMGTTDPVPDAPPFTPVSPPSHAPGIPRTRHFSRYVV